MKTLIFTAFLAAVGTTYLPADDSIVNVARSVLPDGRTCEISKEPNGEVTTFTQTPDGQAGTLECKVVDKAGNTLQWYQSFLDSKGREIVHITRKNPGKNHAYGGVEYISVYTYNTEGNINERYDYNGDGSFRSHVIHVYDSRSKKWIREDTYDVTGAYVGSQSTAPPEAFLYGKKKESGAR